MRRIFVFSKDVLLDYLKNNNINDDNVENIDKYFICIDPTGGPHNFLIFQKYHKNVLRLEFDDVDKDERKWGDTIHQWVDAKVITTEQVAEIVGFLKSVPDNCELIINCTQGMSRSGAVAVYATLLFEQSLVKLIEENPQIGPNKYVLDRLRTYE
jgi:predicted protein tyrosine phosphatase